MAVHMLKASFLCALLYMKHHECSSFPQDVPWKKCSENHPCQCYSKSAMCSNLNLTYIPRFPIKITHLCMYNNKLNHINRTTFMNLTNPLTKSSKLQNLVLLKNRIRTLANDSFTDLNDLTHLHIEGERKLGKGDLAGSFHSLSRGLDTLVLNKINLSNLPSTFFQGLAGTVVVNITLESSYVKGLEGGLFFPVPNLQNLSLHDNLLNYGKANFSSLNNLVFLNLSKNEFVRMTDFCGFNLSKLKVLDMNSNKLSTLKYQFKCLDKLEYLNLDNHAIRLLYSNTFSMLPSLKILHLSTLAEQLHFIRKYAFNSSSLQQLYFSDNAFHFSIDPPNFYPGSLFKHSPSLQILDLSGNLFKHNGTVLKQMLEPLTNLESLSLVDCNLHYLPNYIFGVLPNLRQLLLHTNIIVEWNGHDVFGNTTTLRHIDLSKNHIVVVNKTLFPEHLLQNIEFINLKNNPFSCNCKEVKWFHYWMVKNKEKLCPMRTACKKLICASPSHLKNKALMDLTESEMCPVPKYSKVLVIAITSCFICVLLVTLIIYKARWHIRYLLYMYRLRRNGYESIAGEEGFDYDAFVIYAEEDQAFVHEILVPTLEDREGYHLCIHYRDFQVGKLIADNIVNSIQKSRKVIVILSNSFAKSKWCDFELIIAQNRLILEQNNLLVVILIEKIEPKNITNSLRLILSTMTYANWNAHGTKGEKASFWNQVRHSFRR